MKYKKLYEFHSSTFDCKVQEAQSGACANLTANKDTLERNCDSLVIVSRLHWAIPSQISRRKPLFLVIMQILANVVPRQKRRQFSVFSVPT